MFFKKMSKQPGKVIFYAGQTLADGTHISASLDSRRYGPKSPTASFGASHGVLVSNAKVTGQGNGPGWTLAEKEQATTITKPLSQ